MPHTRLEEGDFAHATAYYPLAGYAVGGAAGLALWLLTPLLPSGVTAALTLGLWLGLTGWLHFDGLVDSADALLAPKTPTERLAILRDVHVGAFGLGVGVLYLLTLWSVLAAGVPPVAPLLAAVLGRALLLLPMRLYPSARAAGQTSLGQAARGSSAVRDLFAVLLTLPALLWAAQVVGLPALAVAVAIALSGALLCAHWAAARLGGGLSGDVYGLLICVGELAALLGLMVGLSA